MTKLTLTSDQQQATALMKKENIKYKLITGYAGTGKTTVITQFLAKIVQTDEFIVTAPTNKAVKVLRVKMREANCWKIQLSTIHSFLGLKVTRKGDRQVLSRDPNRDHPYMNNQGKTIIIDECSMLDKELISYIVELVEDWRYKVIFVGDPKQLPPIGELNSRAFGVEDKVELTEIVRQAKDNPIINLSMQIRDMIDSQRYYKLKPDLSDSRIYTIKRDSKDELHHIENLFASNEYQNDPDYIRYLAWTNKRVDFLNQTIRGFIHGDLSLNLPEFISGERIVTTSPIMDQDEIWAMTDQEFDIGYIEEREWEDIPVWRLQLLGGKKSPVAQVVQSAALRDWESLTQSLVADAKDGSIPWRDYYNWVESFHKVKHCHALTVHRSQGSTFHTTMVDVANVMMNSKKIEALRCLYVACTRPSENLILVMP